MYEKVLSWEVLLFTKSIIDQWERITAHHSLISLTDLYVVKMVIFKGKKKINYVT